MNISGRILTSLVMLLIFGGMSIIALGYPEKARMMPLLVGIPATIMALAQLIYDIRMQLAAKPEVKGTAELRGEIKMFFWLAIFFVGVMSFGFHFAAPILVLAFMRFGQKESWLVSSIGGFAAWAVLYGIFTHGLELFLFEGLLLPLLIG